MPIKHFVTFTIKEVNSLFPVSKTEEIKELDIKKINIPAGTIKVELYNLVVQMVKYKGKEYPAFTNPLDKKTYHIGRFVDIENYTKINKHIEKLYENHLIKGIVKTAYSDAIVMQDDEVLDPNTITKQKTTSKSNSSDTDNQTDL